MKTTNLGLYAFRLTFGQVSTRILNQKNGQPLYAKMRTATFGAN